MRVYIIGNDGITRMRTAPAKVNNGEDCRCIEREMHARVSDKRFAGALERLARVEKRKKVADRDAMIDQLGQRIEVLPDPERNATRSFPPSGVVIRCCVLPKGQRLDEGERDRMAGVTPVRARFSGT